MCYSWSEIPTILGVSIIAIYRRWVEYGLISEPENDLTQEELYEVLCGMRVQSPYMGETMVCGRLRSFGFNVNKYGVRDALRATDPLSTALRSLPAVTSRRHYSVPVPNSLWQ